MSTKPSSCSPVGRSGSTPPVKRPRPGRARQLDTDQTQALIQGYLTGATTYDLGARFGIDRRTMSKILRQHGVQVDVGVHLYNLGWSLKRVGEHLNVDPSTVLSKLRERGIPTRDTHGQPRS
jgi:hypothetical protein